MVAKVRERLAVSNNLKLKFDGERFNPRKLHELQARKHYQIKFSNRFVGLGNISDDEDINRAWEIIKENIKPQVKRF